MAQSINLHPIKIRPTAVYGFGDSTIDSGWFKTEQSPGVYTGDAAYDALLAMALPANAGKPTTNPGPVSILGIVFFPLRQTRQPIRDQLCG